MWRNPKEHNPLIAEERHLLKEEKLLQEMLKEIQLQRHSLQVERLQLESMKSEALKAAKCDPTKNAGGASASDSLKSTESAVKYAEKLDAPEQFNNKTIDLSIVNALDLILEGEYFGSEQESEEESD